MLELKFGDVVAASPQGSGFISTDIAQKEVSIIWDADPDAIHTLIMYDQDAPYPKSQMTQGSMSQVNSRSPYINYLTYNISGNQISSGESMFPYTSPELPPNSLPHRYVVIVYRQPGKIDPSKVDSRSSFPLETFVADNRLELVEYATFTVGTPVQTVSTPSSPLTQPISGEFFKEGTLLTPEQRNYCACVLKVAEKQPGECNTDKAWFDERQGETCYNPYAVCTKSTRTSYRHCGQEYNFETMSDEYLITYAQLSGVSIPTPYNRSEMIAAIMAWKASKA